MLTLHLAFRTKSALYNFFWGDTNKCLLTPERTPTTDERNDPIKIQLGKPIHQLVLVTGVRMRGGVEDSKAATSSKCQIAHPPPPVKTQETCMLRLSAWLAGSSPSWRNSSALQLLLLIWPWGGTLGIFWAKYRITHCSCSKHRTCEPSAVNGIPFPANPGNFWLIPNFAKPL